MDEPAAAQLVVRAVDDLALIATAGFFVPAALVVGFVIFHRDDQRQLDGGPRSR